MKRNEKKGVQGIAVHESAKEIQGLREDFERGLLAAIINEQRASGVAMMGSVAWALSRKDWADDTWHLLWRWLEAVRKGDTALNTESFALLRDAGRYLKALDQQGSDAAQGALPALEPLRVALTRLLVELDGPPPEESEHWTQLLDDLDQTSEVADMRSGFQQVYDYAAPHNWTDVMEICGAQNNLLDRLIDETLVIDRNHYQVLTDAKMLLRDLTAPEAIGESSRPSQIDDLSYERVIERADVLASGGEFELTADDAPQAIEATAQLAAVLDILPSLLIRVREEVASNRVDSSLSDSLEMLSQTVKELQQKLPD